MPNRYATLPLPWPHRRQGLVKPDTAKVYSVKTFKHPKRKKDVRSFLGLAGYYRHFIPSFATIAAPPTDLTKKDRPDRVQWTDVHQNAFDQLRAALSSDSVLRGPDFDKPFVIQTVPLTLASLQCSVRPMMQERTTPQLTTPGNYSHERRIMLPSKRSA